MAFFTNHTITLKRRMGQDRKEAVISMKLTFWPVTLIALSGCISSPPPFDANPHVVVEYQHAIMLPGAKDVFFIKKVSQKRTEMARDATGFLTGGGYYPWTATPWTRFYICSADAVTGQKKVISEWPKGLCTLVHDDWFRISRPLKLAVLNCDGPVAVMNLDTLKWRYIDFTRFPFSTPGGSPDLSPDEKEFVIVLLAKYAPITQKPQEYGVVISDFEGHMRIFIANEPITWVKWMQKSNLIRIWYKDRCVVVKPDDFSVVEELKPPKAPFVGTLPAGEDRSPLDAQYGSPPFDLGTPGSYKGSFSPSKAASMW